MNGPKRHDYEEDEGASWASFNPFFQDSLKHTEILERLVADGEAFDLHEVENDKNGLGFETTLELPKDHEQGEEFQEETLTSEEPFQEDTLDFGTSGVNGSPHLGSPAKRKEDTTRSTSHQHVLTHPTPSAVEPLLLSHHTSTSLPGTHRSTATLFPSSLEVSEPLAPEATSPHTPGDHSRDPTKTRSQVPVSLLGEPSLALHLTSPFRDPGTKANDGNTFSLDSGIPRVLQECSEPFHDSPDPSNQDLEGLSRFVVQAKNHVDQNKGFSFAEVTLWRVAFDDPSFQTAQYLWSRRLTKQQGVVTHVAFLKVCDSHGNTQPLCDKDTPWKELVKTPQHLMSHDSKMADYLTDDVTIALSGDLDPAMCDSRDSSGYKPQDVLSPEVECVETPKKKEAVASRPLALFSPSFPHPFTPESHSQSWNWCVALVTTPVESFTPNEEAQGTAASFLWVCSASNGLIYLDHVPLEGGRVTHVVTCQNDGPCTKPFQYTARRHPVHVRPLGFLTSLGKLHVLHTTLGSLDERLEKRQTCSKDLWTSPRFQRQCLDISALPSSPNTPPVALALFHTVWEKVRLFVLFADGLAYCYDEFHIVHPLDELRFVHSNFVRLVPDLSYRASAPHDFLLHDSWGHPVFSSLAYLQQESWKLYHTQQEEKQKKTQKKTTPSPSPNLNLGDILLQCLKHTHLFSSPPQHSGHKSLISSCESSPQALSSLQRVYSSFPPGEEDLPSSKVTPKETHIHTLSLDHLFHQVRASALLASPADFVYWLPLLCVRLAENDPQGVLEELFDMSLHCMYQEAKLNLLFSSPPYSSSPSLSDPLRRDTNSSFLLKQPLDPVLDLHPTQHITPHHHATQPSPAQPGHPSAHPPSSPWQGKSLPVLGEEHPHAVHLLWWLQPCVLHDMGLTSFQVFSHLIVKTLVPETLWSTFSLQHVEESFFPPPSPTDFSIPHHLMPSNNNQASPKGYMTQWLSKYRETTQLPFATHPPLNATPPPPPYYVEKLIESFQRLTQHLKALEENASILNRV